MAPIVGNDHAKRKALKVMDLVAFRMTVWQAQCR